MDSGMLWFDNDPKIDLGSKISRAATYYCKKYGHEPNICYLHPSMIEEGKKVIGTIRLQASTAMIPYHFWLEEVSKEKIKPER